MRFNQINNLRSIVKIRNPILQYNDALNQEAILNILDELERLLEGFGEPLKVIRKTFNIATESLQNITKYADPNIHRDALPIFVLDRQKDRYIVASGNLIHKSKVDGLKKRMDHINSLDWAGIQQAYKEVIRANLNNKNRDKNSAGLGLIEMVRKSRQKLRYEFRYYNNECVYFLLVVTVPRPIN